MANTNLNFADDLKKYGADDFEACYNCGNCSAICSLTNKDDSFPRELIRFSVLGLKKS
jgi:heterodisulfide reductase subunit C